MYRYTAGKQDWFASDLPREGEAADVRWIGDVAWREVPTCRLDERIGDVRARLPTDRDQVCVVVNAEQVVLGLLRAKALGADPQATAEAVMRAGPTTQRPNTPLQDLVEQMHQRGTDHALVTTGDGRLVGWLSREAAERAARGAATPSGKG